VKTTRVTRAEALAVLSAVKKQFRPYLAKNDQPVLIRDWSWVDAPNYSVIWEGGPYDWAINFGHADVDEEMTALRRADDPAAPVARFAPVEVPATVYTEPYSGYALCIWQQIAAPYWTAADAAAKRDAADAAEIARTARGWRPE